MDAGYFCVTSPLLNKYVGVYFFIAALSVPLSSHAQADTQSPITAKELRSGLRTENDTEIVAALNRAKQNQSSFELMDFIKKLWDSDPKVSAGLSSNALSKDVIRIEFANILIQADNNGYIKSDREAIRTYAKDVLKAPDQEAVSTAVSTLGLLRNPDDIPMIKELALQERPRTFWSAVIALAQSCDKRAALALEDVKKRVALQESKKFLSDASTFIAGFKTRCKT